MNVNGFEIKLTGDAAEDYCEHQGKVGVVPGGVIDGVIGHKVLRECAHAVGNIFVQKLYWRIVHLNEVYLAVCVWFRLTTIGLSGSEALARTM